MNQWKAETTNSYIARDVVGNEKVKMDPFPVQHASDIIGDWGPLQRNVVIFYILTYIVAPFQNVGITLFTPKMNFWCKRPPGFENATLQTCNSYENTSLPCTDFEYDMSFYEATATNEFDLVCNREWMVSMSASAFQIGCLVSSILVGFLSDRYGRLVALKFSFLLEISTGIFICLSANIFFFLLGRFVLGIASYGRYLAGAILVMELVGPKYRDTVRCAIEAGWCIGYLIVPGLNYLIPNFRKMQLVVVAYQSLFVYALYKLPESTRWQLTNGQFAEAEKTIIRAAEMREDLDEEQLCAKLKQLKIHLDEHKETNLEESKQTLVDIWKIPKLRTYCLALYVIWFGTLFVYYGFSYNVGVIGDSLHVNIFIQALAESINMTVLYFTINQLPRKTFEVLLMVACGLSCLATIPFTFNDDYVNYRILLAMIGKLTIAGVTQLLYVHSPEIFPTTIRHVGVGSCSVSARFGSMLAPFAKDLARVTSMSVMMASMGVLSILNTIMVQLLPETRHFEMPDTLEEAEIMLGNKKRREATQA